MDEIDLLVTLAEIAGVFVGFGALIAVRSGDPSDVREVVYIRSVLAGGLWVVVAGLAPATLSAYEIAGHNLWLVCSLVGLGGFVLMEAFSRRNIEFREAMAGLSRERKKREIAGNAALVLPLVAALLLVVLGLFPDRDAALYLTAVVLGLLLTALVLLWLVFEQRRPAAPTGGAAPAAG